MTNRLRKLSWEALLCSFLVWFLFLACLVKKFGSLDTKLCQSEFFEVNLFRVSLANFMLMRGGVGVGSLGL